MVVMVVVCVVVGVGVAVAVDVVGASVVIVVLVVVGALVVAVVVVMGFMVVVVVVFMALMVPRTKWGAVIGRSNLLSRGSMISPDPSMLCLYDNLFAQFRDFLNGKFKLSEKNKNEVDRL